MKKRVIRPIFRLIALVELITSRISRDVSTMQFKRLLLEHIPTNRMKTLTYVDSGNTLELPMSLNKLGPFRTEHLLNARPRQFNNRGLRGASASLKLTRLLYSTARTRRAFLLGSAG